jgi:hypothetical protein
MATDEQLRGLHAFTIVWRLNVEVPRKAWTKKKGWLKPAMMLTCDAMQQPAERRDKRILLSATGTLEFCVFLKYGTTSYEPYTLPYISQKLARAVAREMDERIQLRDNPEEPMDKLFKDNLNIMLPPKVQGRRSVFMYEVVPVDISAKKLVLYDITVDLDAEQCMQLVRRYKTYVVAVSVPSIQKDQVLCDVDSDGRHIIRKEQAWNANTHFTERFSDRDDFLATSRIEELTAELDHM